MSDHELIRKPASSKSDDRRKLYTATSIMLLSIGGAGLAEAQTATAVSTRDSLINACTSGANTGTQFQTDCDAILVSPANESDFAIDQVAADQVSAQNAAGTRQVRTSLGAVGGRLARIRLASGNSGIDGGLAIAQTGDFLGTSGGGASGDVDFGDLGGFVTLKYRWGDHDLTGFQPGFDFDGWGAIGGIDFRVTDKAVAGVALSYASDDVDYDGNRGDLSSDAWGVTLYGSWNREDGLYVDGMLGYSWADYDLNRRLVYTTTVNAQNVNQTASSSADGELLSAAVGAGFNIARGATTYTPALRLEYASNDVDGFTETMSNPTADGGTMLVSVDDATYTSLTSRLGVQVSHAISHASGVILPSVQLDWVHEFDNDQERVRGRFVADLTTPTQPFFVFTDNPDRDYFDLQVAVSGQFAQGVSAFLSYNTLLGFSDLSYHAVNAGVRVEF
jgi:outer membrane autotransporter protein